MEARLLTNEEKRTKIYSNKSLPTIPSKVTSKTPLKNLNLNWTEKELPEKVRTKHVNRLHPYLGKFIPQIAEIFLRRYFKPGSIVLDPFCGSGTTLVQANELGINSVGFDISAFNVMLCEVKTQNYNLRRLRDEIKDILQRVEERLFPQINGNTLFGNILNIPQQIITDNNFLNAWFSQRALNELLTFQSFIADYEYQDVLKIILSRSARSARLTTHFDLDFPKKPQTEPYHCYKHNRICQPTQEAYKFLLRYGLDTIKRIEEYSHLRSNAFVHVRNVDSRTAELEYEIDGIITSPPYVGLIDYHDQHNYAFNLLGLMDQSEIEIGPAKEGSSKKAKEKYMQDMAAVFLNASRFLKPRGKLVVIAGDKNDLYPTIAEMANLSLKDTVVRHVNRRTGRRSTHFYETVFIYAKKS